MLEKLHHKEIKFLIWLFLIALSVRLGFMLYAKQHYFFYQSPSSDVTYYLDWANEIATQNAIGTKAFFGLPLYPYFLAVLHRLTFGHTEVIRFFLLLLGSLNCLLIYVLGKRLFSQRVGVVASLLMCFNFFLVYYDWLMMPATLIITLSLCILIALNNVERLTTKREWAILGLLIGLAILGDGKFLFFLVMFLLWLLINKPHLRRQAVIMTLAAVTVLGGCALRNKLVSGDWILISAQSGLSFYSGNNPDATGTYHNPKFIRPTHAGQDEDQQIVIEAMANRQMSPAAVSSFWKKETLKFIRANRRQYAALLGKKISLFFRETEHAHDMDLLFLRNWKYRLNWNGLFLIFPLALIGIRISYHHWKTKPSIIMLIFSQLLFTVIFFLSTRHRITILPLLILFQSAAIFWLISKLKQKNFLAIGAALIFIIIFAVIFHPIIMDQDTIDYNRFAKAGAVYDKQGDLLQAKKNYYKALSYAPADSNTLYNLGNVYFQEGDLLKAKQLYQSALKVCHYNVDAIFNLGIVHEKMGETNQALKLYKKVNHYQPDIPDIYFRMANIYANESNCASAIPLYQKIIELDPALQDHIQIFIDQCN